MFPQHLQHALARHAVVAVDTRHLDTAQRKKGRLKIEEGRKEMLSTHFIYGYMASDIWQRTIQIAREETHCHHMGCSYRLAARALLYASSHRQDNTYHGLCYTSRGALAGTRNSSMGPPCRIDPTTHRTMTERSYHGAVQN